MTTETPALTCEALAVLPASYFKAVDAQDPDAVVSHFAQDATLTVHRPCHVHGSGRDPEDVQRLLRQLQFNLP